MSLEQLIEQKREVKKMLESAIEHFDEVSNEYKSIENAKKNLLFWNKKSNKGYAIIIPLLLYSLVSSLFLSYRVGNYIISLIVIILLVMAIWSLNKDKRIKVKKIEEISKELSNNINVLGETYDSYEYKELLHFKYSDPRILKRLYKLVDEGRADSLKEAINLMHSNKQSAELIKQQEAVLTRMDKARKQNAVIGTAAVLSILFSSGRD